MSPVVPSAKDVRAFRTSRDWTQAELAERLGVSKRTIEDWEAGRTRPPAMLALAFKALEA